MTNNNNKIFNSSLISFHEEAWSRDFLNPWWQSTVKLKNAPSCTSINFALSCASANVHELWYQRHLPQIVDGARSRSNMIPAMDENLSIAHPGRLSVFWNPEIQMKGRPPQITRKMEPFKVSSFRKQFKFFADICLWHQWNYRGRNLTFGVYIYLYLKMTTSITSMYCAI